MRASFFGQSSFATHSLLTERNIVRMPPYAPLRYLAGLTCDIQSGAGAILNATPVGPGRSVAILGAGSVGLAAVMAASASGADDIIVIDGVAHRLAIAAGLGATHVLDTAGRDLREVVAEVVKMTRGGADIVLDTTCQPDMVMAGVESLAAHGTCSIITNSGVSAALPPGVLLARGRRLLNTVGGHISPVKNIAHLLDLHARGRFPFDRLVRNYPFAELDTALADSTSGATIKPVLTLEWPQ